MINTCLRPYCILISASGSCIYSLTSIFLPAWRGGRVVEGARLESVYTETYRGFESLSLRQNNFSKYLIISALYVLTEAQFNVRINPFNLGYDK